FDVLIVDEAHRLNQRANQPSGMQNKRFRLINETLFGEDHDELTQLDWIREKSKHRVLMIDYNQTVRPADINRRTVNELVGNARDTERYFVLQTQMRVKAGANYPEFFRQLLDGSMDMDVPDLGEEYEIGIFTNLGQMRSAIKRRDDRYDLSRMVAGFAWEWKSKR